MKKNSPNILFVSKALKRACGMKLETDLPGFVGRNMFLYTIKTLNTSCSFYQNLIYKAHLSLIKISFLVANEDVERTQMDVHDDGRKDYKSFKTAAEHGEISSKAPATNIA